MKDLLFTIMSLNFCLAVAIVLVGCGSGEDKTEGSPGINVSGDNNFVALLEESECVNFGFRFVSNFRDSTEETNVCADGSTSDDEACADCFDDEFLLEEGFLSNEGCVEERVLQGECGSEQLQEQAQAAARGE